MGSAVHAAGGSWLGRSRRVLPGARAARRAGSVILAIATWHVVALTSPSRLLPAPLDVLDSLVAQIQTSYFWDQAASTLLRGSIGLALATVVGVLLGIAMARVPLVEAATEPLLSATYPVPRLAFYPFLLLAFGLGGTAQIAIVFLECVYAITYTTYSGVRLMPRELLWVARNAGAGRLVTVARVLLPASLGSIMAGLRTAVPLMLVVIVVTELIGESRGLGFLIRDFGTNFDPAGALAVVAFLACVGALADRIVVVATRRIVFWEKGVQQWS